MKKMKINYSEGTCFALPLRNGGFARGVVSRLNGAGGVLGYFFGPQLASIPDVLTAFDPKPKDAVLCGRFSHLGLVNGEWPLLKELPKWSRDEWPLPVFVRIVDENAIVSTYNDSLKFMGERVLSAGETPVNVCNDSSMGYGFVEIRLTKLLSPDSPS